MNIAKQSESMQIDNIKNRIMSMFASSPSSKHRAVTKVTRRILLNAPYLLNGSMWEVKAKSLGAGVYELSIEKQKHTGETS